MHHQQIRQDQSGFASIVIAMMLILVLSLITVGFAQLARREQQNALNKQLSSQAYYAAEAGINDAYYMTMLPNGLYDKETITPGSIASDSCLNTTADWTNPDNPPGQTQANQSGDVEGRIDVNTDTSYSCVMVDLHPSTLTYSNVSAGSYRSAVFAPTDLDGGADELKTLEIHWGTADNHGGIPTSTPGKFKPQTGSADNWGNNLAVIQVNITPLTPSFTREYLQNNTYTVYLYPQSGPGSTINYDLTPSNNATVKSAHCDNTPNDKYNQCRASIAGIPGDSTYNYLVHFTTYYDDSNILINGRNGAGQAIGTKGAQIVVDSTGKARDVLKRLQVHMPLNPEYSKPDFALQAQSICKRFTTLPGAASHEENPGVYAGNACRVWQP